MNYKFKPDDKVKIMSYTGAEDGFPVTVYAAYTSDKENHPAAPHNRYVCFEDDLRSDSILGHIHDVSENELELIK
jgi:hypothetical protein